MSRRVVSRSAATSVRAPGPSPRARPSSSPGGPESCVAFSPRARSCSEGGGTTVVRWRSRDLVARDRVAGSWIAGRREGGRRRVSRVVRGRRVWGIRRSARARGDRGDRARDLYARFAPSCAMFSVGRVKIVPRLPNMYPPCRPIFLGFPNVVPRVHNHRPKIPSPRAHSIALPHLDSSPRVLQIYKPMFRRRARLSQVSERPRGRFRENRQ